MKPPEFDVLGLGCVAVDDLCYVERFPPPDANTSVLRRTRQCGGLTATALVAAARFGARCGYAGCLGDDELSRFAKAALRRAGVDVRWVVRRAEARPVYSVIVVDEGAGTRNIFYDLAGVVGADAKRPPAAVLRGTRVLLVDYLGLEGMIRAARIARAAGIPVVADFDGEASPRLREAVALADHLIVNRVFARKLTGLAEPRAAARALWTSERRAVVVTDGERGCWYLAGEQGSVPRHQRAFSVPVVDTTGCGDVFHGAYAATLARGAGSSERVAFASAAAALKAGRRGGQAGVPTRAAVEQFLDEHR